jgi:protein-arginine kinase activator protein McsA
MMEENEMKNTVNEIDNIDVMSAEELIKGLLELEALKEIMDGFIKLDKLGKVDPFTASDSATAPDAEVQQKPYAENRPISFNKPEVNICPEAKMRREFYSMMHRAIESENYEEAARLRDLMKAIA